MSAKAIVYLRQSSEKQEKSLEDQLRWALDEIARRALAFRGSFSDLKQARAAGKHSVGDIYFDDAVTGANMKRPGLTAYRERAKEGGLFCLFYARDRFARPDQPLEAMQYEYEIRGFNNHVLTSRGLFPPTPYAGGPSIPEQMVALYEYGDAGAYVFNLSRTLLPRMALKARRGEWCGGEPPYGFARYLLTESTGLVEPLAPGT